MKPELQHITGILCAREDATVVSTSGNVYPVRENETDNEGKQHEVPRLPSIKHLQLDMGLPWHNADHSYPLFYTTQLPPTSSSSQSLSSTFSSTPTTPQTFISPSPSPVPSTSYQHKHDKPYRDYIPTSSSASLGAPSIQYLTSSSMPSTPNTSSRSVPVVTPSVSAATNQAPSQDVLVPVVTNNCGFIETTFANVPLKKPHRRRPANIDKSTLYCHNCGAKNTPEWRRGPTGPATLCNACGLAYAKRVKHEEDSQVQMQANAANLARPQQCTCEQASVYGRCVHGNVSYFQPRNTTSLRQVPTRLSGHTFHQYTPPSPHTGSTQSAHSTPVINNVL